MVAPGALVILTPFILGMNFLIFIIYNRNFIRTKNYHRSFTRIPYFRSLDGYFCFKYVTKFNNKIIFVEEELGTIVKNTLKPET